MVGQFGQFGQFRQCSGPPGREREGGRKGGREQVPLKGENVHAPTGSSKYRVSVRTPGSTGGQQVGRWAGTEGRWPAHVLSKYRTVLTEPGVRSKGMDYPS